jgi:NAD(P)-dependent dehydrogenase (short-subunit alcohol dehydrogenase family)
VKKKLCIITGGAGFLGSKFCKFFSKNNYSVICIDNNKININKFRSIKNITILNYDVTNEEHIKKIFDYLKKIKNIDCLINNAAIDAVPSSGNKKNFKYPEINSWQKEFNVGILGSFLMIKYFGEKMIKQKHGSIINIGSDLSVLAPNQKIYEKSYKNYYKPPTYSVIKYGLLGLTKYYSSLYAKNGVRVNMVSPGPIKNKQNKKLIHELKQQIPMNRLSEPMNLYGLLLFLAEDHSKYITGQNILVDGGRSII